MPPNTEHMRMPFENFSSWREQLPRGRLFQAHLDLPLNFEPDAGVVAKTFLRLLVPIQPLKLCRQRLRPIPVLSVLQVVAGNRSVQDERTETVLVSCEEQSVSCIPTHKGKEERGYRKIYKTACFSVGGGGGGHEYYKGSSQRLSSLLIA